MTLKKNEGKKFPFPLFFHVYILFAAAAAALLEGKETSLENRFLCRTTFSFCAMGEKCECVYVRGCALRATRGVPVSFFFSTGNLIRFQCCPEVVHNLVRTTTASPRQCLSDPYEWEVRGELE